jgi:hypothetical protein
MLAKMVKEIHAPDLAVEGVMGGGGGGGGGVVDVSGGVPSPPSSSPYQWFCSFGRFDRWLNDVRTPALVCLCPRYLLDKLIIN